MTAKVQAPPPTELSSIVVADDDAALAREITDYVGRFEFSCLTAATWDETIQLVESVRPAAMILDQWLGPVDTLTRLPQLRRLSAAPILILTANREEADRIIGLELGADDFLSKPISGRELVARLRAHLRRARSSGNGAWTLDRAAHRLARADGASIHLTTAEFDVLSLLSERTGEVQSRDALSRAVFRRPWQPGDRAVDTIVANLRAKLDGSSRPGADRPSCITTVRPTGYRFVKFPD